MCKRTILAADAEIDDREARWWARRAAEESATLAGVLIDLAEAGTEVVLRTVGARTHRGSIVAVGPDTAIVASAAGLVLVPLARVSSVRAGADAATTRTGDRHGEGARLASLLADLVADRPEVSVAVEGDADLVHGRLLAAGADLVTVRAGHIVIHVPIAAITDVVVRG